MMTMSYKFLKKGGNTLKKFKYPMLGLDCAACAKKIEEHLNRDKHLKNVLVNFGTAMITFESDLDKDIYKYVNNKIHEVEPEAKIVSKTDFISSSNNALRLLLSLILFILSFFFKNSINLVLILSVYVILLSKTLVTALKKLTNKIVDESLLITISCIGAFFIGEKVEGAVVLLLYELGKLLEDKAINSSRKAVTDLVNFKPEFANNAKGEIINPKDVLIGDIILVKPGEKVPLDGIVIEGISHLDTSSLTGESRLIKIEKGQEILSGSINQEGLIKLKATANYENSTASKILDLVETATEKKTNTETFVNKVSKIYTPIVILLAVLVAVVLPLFLDLSFKQSLYRALTFLVISCPCAIVISVPLSYFSGIGIASRKGILVKGSTYLDNLRNVKEIIFDKTGTLTTGKFCVDYVKVLKGNEENLLHYAVLGESFSHHPLAFAILNYYHQDFDNSKVKNYKEIAGRGISYSLDGKKVKVGNDELVNYPNKVNDTAIFVKVDEEILGYITFTDKLKEDAYNTILNLHQRNIKISIFTGDNKMIAKEVGQKLDVDEVQAEMLPDDKYYELEKKKRKNYLVAFVGDGLNDSPVLASADIGISMGLNGSNAAIESSDIVIMNDNLNKLWEAIDISKLTHKIIKENLLLAFTIKFIILGLSTFGISSMWHAIFADVGVTLITIFNTLRILKH